MLRLKTWSAREASIHSAFMGKWPTIISLIHPKDELSLKEIRMWGQSKISSCFICDWCESREMGGRQSPRLPKLSSDLLPAIKSQWTRSPFELGILLGEQDTKLLHMMPLLLEQGEEIDFFLCMCSRNCIIIIVIINIIVYKVVVVVVC